MIRTSATCDSCGKLADMQPYEVRVSFSLKERRPPAAWLTVKPLWPGTHITLPVVPDDRNPDPDLCSWACVAAYAAKQAETQSAEAG
jgi:hypothetical protein